MEYHGKLYGHFAGKYVELEYNTENVHRMEKSIINQQKRIAELEDALNEIEMLNTDPGNDEYGKQFAISEIVKSLKGGEG